MKEFTQVSYETESTLPSTSSYSVTNAPYHEPTIVLPSTKDREHRRGELHAEA